jgi:hypothetical protein
MIAIGTPRMRSGFSKIKIKKRNSASGDDRILEVSLLTCLSHYHLNASSQNTFVESIDKEAFIIAYDINDMRGGVVHQYFRMEY